MRRSAATDGVSPFADNFARTNRSMGLAASPAGTAGSATGLNAQWSAADLDAVLAAAGNAAPDFTHCSSAATASPVSGLFGGMG